MGRHTFNLEGGEELTTMGACWFVSYAYYKWVDNGHVNWKKVSTSSSRISVYDRTKEMHKFWLLNVLNMNDNNLNKNTIGLNGKNIKTMAQKILNKM